MKKLWNTFVSICEGFSRARAAAELSRLGHHDLARKMMLKD